VTQLRGQLQSITDVRAQLAAVEVLWRESVTPYLSVLSAAEQVESLGFRSDAPAEPALGVTGPLRAPRTATIRLVITTVEVPTPYTWFRSWEKIDTFADASIDSITSQQDGYETAVTINLNDLALAQRFGATEVTE
jgi:hypothetical protein